MNIEDIKIKVKNIEKSSLKAIQNNEKFVDVIKAPPGSGKTRLLISIAYQCYKKGMKVAIATQTNTQADDICKRITEKIKNINLYRYISSGYRNDEIKHLFINRTKYIEAKNFIVVGTSAKWGATDVNITFDICFVEEAWQLSWSNFILLDQVSHSFILIGDPGQIPPVVAVDISRWATSKIPPYKSAPEIIIKSQGLEDSLHNLPATWRLPKDTADVIKNFYDFDFIATAEKDSRILKPMKKRSSSKIANSFHNFSKGSIMGLTIKTPRHGPPLEKDMAVVRTVIETIQELFACEPIVYIDGENEKLTPNDIGIVATHRIMVTSIKLALPLIYKDSIQVDTPERWQGLQKKVMIIVHPLSGNINLSSFDLETGRLCVMASRHRVGLIIVSRDHVKTTLEDYYPVADQPFYEYDISGQGHYLNSEFWNSIYRKDMIVKVA
jgi:superfamily I DNA and/or RNA helicase